MTAPRACLVVLAVVAGIYAPLLGNGFWADDYTWLDRCIQAEREPSLPLTAVYGRDYNPLSFLSFVVTFRLFGTEPQGWHAFDLCVHLVCVALLLLVGRKLGGSVEAGALAALLFGTHVALSEPVLWSAARVHSQALAALLAGMLCHLGEGRRWRDAAFAACLVAAVNFKETALAYAGVLAAWWLWARVRGTPLPGRSARAAAVALAVAAAYAGLRLAFLPVRDAAGGARGLDVGRAATKLALTLWSFVGLDERLPGSPLLVALPVVVLLAALLLVRSPGVALAILMALGTATAHLPAARHSSRYCYLPLAGLSLAAALAASALLQRSRSRAVRVAALALLAAWLSWSAISVQVEIRDYRRLAALCSEQLRELAPAARVVAERVRRKGKSVRVAFVDARRPSPLATVVGSLNGRQKLVNYVPRAVAGILAPHAAFNVAIWPGIDVRTEAAEAAEEADVVVAYGADGRTRVRAWTASDRALPARRSVLWLVVAPR